MHIDVKIEKVISHSDRRIRGEERHEVGPAEDAVQGGQRQRGCGRDAVTCNMRVPSTSHSTTPFKSEIK